MLFDITKKAIPIGMSDFKEFNRRNYYYVDKTLMIKDILDNRAYVSLFTRPRRFGKTLNLSMIKYFFEKTEEDNSYLFKDLKIWGSGEIYREYQGKYPVINLDFKSGEGLNWETAYESLKLALSNEYSRHSYLLDKPEIIKEQKEREVFERVRNNKASEVEYIHSIKNLCIYLERYYSQKPILLIDEYDVPLQRAYINNYYKPAISFIRGLLQDALKTNNSLEFAIITGCLRVSKESIFTGLNNLNIYSILEKKYAEHFGFSQKEVEEILEYYKLEEKKEEIKNWYNGYRFGSQNIYNPWSILKYVEQLQCDIDKLPEAYWVNTSGNDIVKELIKNADNITKNEIEILINSGTIEKALNANVTYNELEENIDNIWSMLFFTGYLTYTKEKREADTEVSYYELRIPNKELMFIYKTIIRNWFKEKVREKDLSKLYQSLIDGDEEELSAKISDILLENISYYDSGESFYHGLLTGILSSLDKYRFLSNLESGHGRSDIILEPTRIKQSGIIIEIKLAKEIDELEAKCEEALKQIEEKQYETYLKKRGFNNVLKYGIAFCGKICKVKKSN